MRTEAKLIGADIFEQANDQIGRRYSAFQSYTRLFRLAQMKNAHESFFLKKRSKIPSINKVQRNHLA